MASHEAKTSKRRIVGLERQLRALELRKAGYSYRAIAEELGISVSAAYRATTRALKRLNEKTQEEAEVVRRLELERLDDLLLAMWPKAQNGDQGAVDRILRIMERRARLLGLDAPLKEETDIGTALAQILERLADAGDSGDA